MAAFVIFLGSFISFALEPMVGRALLPVFGGAPTVWVTCLAAFQLLMVAGYGYAGFVGAGNRRERMGLHLILLAASAGWCVVIAFTKNSILASLSVLTGIPTIDVFICVMAICALAFVLLSANATLVQSVGGGNYRLYAVSNLGSFLGLFCYPCLVEPYVALTSQWLILAAAIVVYAAFLFLCAKSSENRKAEELGPGKADDSRCSALGLRPSTLKLLYFTLPAITAALLNATTAHLTLDVAPIPLLWALLLGIFLLSYVIGFSGWSRPAYWALPAAASAVLLLSMYFFAHDSVSWKQLFFYSAAFFLIATFIHSWLYAIRPSASRLSRYYLLNVVGGAVGGLFTALLAPVVFDSVLEFPLTISTCIATFLCWAFLSAGRTMRIAVILTLAGTAGLLPLVTDIGPKDKVNVRTTIHRARDFFGTLSVLEVKSPNQGGTTTVTHSFCHGNTTHGIEFIGQELERMPTTYYTPFGCGHAIIGHPSYAIPQYVAMPNPRPMRVCLVGMGTGVCFAYARTNDYYRAYEISAKVAEIARNKDFFAFIDTCLAKPDIRIMDARKGLEAESAANEEKYDVIIVDAFTGDCIPYHLSTREAVELYLSRLKPDGVLCIHFSNKYLDLRPYIKSLSGEFNLKSCVYLSAEDFARLGFSANVALFMRKDVKMAEPPFRSGMCAKMDLSDIKPLTPFPTDERGSFLPLVDFSDLEPASND